MKLNMVATKPMRYGTRRLLAGDKFECPERHAKLFMILKRAKEHERAKVDIPPMPQGLKAQAAVSDETSALRAEYQAMLGRRPYHGWDAAELRRRMADAAT